MISRPLVQLHFTENDPDPLRLPLDIVVERLPMLARLVESSIGNASAGGHGTYGYDLVPKSTSTGGKDISKTTVSTIASSGTEESVSENDYAASAHVRSGGVGGGGVVVRRIDMWKLGLTLDHFVIALSRVSDIPILTGIEEYQLRKKYGIIALDEVDLNDPFGAADARKQDFSQYAEPEVEGLGSDNVSAWSSSPTASAPLPQTTERSPAELPVFESVIRSARAPLNVYNLLGLFGVNVDPVFREIFFEGELKTLLRPGIQPHSDPNEAELISLHLPDGTSSIRPGESRDREGVFRWPTDVMVLACDKYPLLDPSLNGVFPSLSGVWQSFRPSARKLVQAILNARFTAPGMRFVLAGGSVFSTVTKKSHDDSAVPGDFDFFLVLPHLLNIPKAEREVEAHVCVTEAIEFVVELIEKQVAENEKARQDKPREQLSLLLTKIVAFQRSDHAVTVYMKEWDRGSYFSENKVVAFQFVGYYSSAASVVETFDIGSCQLLADGERFYATRKGLIALASGVNLVTQNDLSPQYVYRLGKYFKRGMKIAVPVHYEAQQNQHLVETLFGQEWSKYVLAKRAAHKLVNDKIGAKLVEIQEENEEQMQILSHAVEFQEENDEQTLGGDVNNGAKLRALSDKMRRMVLKYKKDVVDPEMRSLRQQNYENYMARTSIPERIIIMGGRLRLVEFGNMYPMFQIQPHKLDACDTFITPTSEGMTRSFPPMLATPPIPFPPMLATSFVNVNREVLWQDVIRGSRVLDLDWSPDDRSELIASITVEEGTSCGTRLLSGQPDAWYGNHLRTLQKQGRSSSILLSDKLAVVLNPHKCRTNINLSSDDDIPSAGPADFVASSTSSSSGTSSAAAHVLPRRCTIPVPSGWQLGSEFSSGEIPVPPKLARPFRMHPRDGKGSFEKKEPEEVIASGQWFVKNVPIDRTLRWVLRVE